MKQRVENKINKKKMYIHTREKTNNDKKKKKMNI